MKLETCKGKFSGSMVECIAWLEEMQPAIAEVNGCSMNVGLPWAESIFLAVSVSEDYSAATNTPEFELCQWENLMPVIDANRCLTGEAVDWDADDFTFYNWENNAAIRGDDARAGGWNLCDDGYAEPPSEVAQ